MRPLPSTAPHSGAGCSGSASCLLLPAGAQEQEPRRTAAPSGRPPINRPQTSTSARQQNRPNLSAAQAVILKIQPSTEPCKFALLMRSAGTQPPCPLGGAEVGLARRPSVDRERASAHRSGVQGFTFAGKHLMFYSEKGQSGGNDFLSPEQQKKKS